MISLHKNTQIGVCGAGAMGVGIAQVAAQSGHPVIVYDSYSDSLTKGQQSFSRSMAALLKRGKVNEDEAKTLQARIEWTDDIEKLSGCGLIIEAIIESLDIKTELLQRLEQTVASNCVLATNTSSLSVSSLAFKLHRPQNFLGLHFFNPAPIMKLVEVIEGLRTDQKVADACYVLMKEWNKKPVKAKDVPGFIVNRVARPFYGEGWQAYEEGVADAATIDFLYRDLAGFRMGPLELGDLIGHDVNNKAARSVYNSYHGRTRFRPSLLQNQYSESGQLGRKSGKGIYDYSEEAVKPEPNYKPETKAQRIVRGPRTNIYTALGSKTDISSNIPAGFWLVDDVLVGFTDGRSARIMADIHDGHAAVLDYVRDINSATSLAYSANSDRADQAARSLISESGKKSVRIEDRPGAVIFRTMLQLVNAAADAVRDQVASIDAIDTALQFGVNYPFGPMAWVKSYGVSNAINAMCWIGEETGERDFYAPNHILKAML